MIKSFFFRGYLVFLWKGLLFFSPLAGLPLVHAANPINPPLRVFIDPGHGGSDRGAVHAGLSEAELVLQVGRRLQSLLEKDPQVQTQMSRQSEKFLSLPERVEMAEKWGADVFLSLHANASHDQRARGVEFYFQNHLKPDEDSFYYANLENQLSTKIQEEGLNKSTDVLSILEDLKKTHRIWQSFALSQALLQGWTIEKKTRSQHIRQAPFQVVSAGAYASVLIELGFLSNPREAQSLRSPETQTRIAQQIAKGLTHFKTEVLDREKARRVNLAP